MQKTYFYLHGELLIQETGRFFFFCDRSERSNWLNWQCSTLCTARWSAVDTSCLPSTLLVCVFGFLSAGVSSAGWACVDGVLIDEAVGRKGQNENRTMCECLFLRVLVLFRRIEERFISPPPPKWLRNRCATYFCPSFVFVWFILDTVVVCVWYVSWCVWTGEFGWRIEQKDDVEAKQVQGYE